MNRDYAYEKSNIGYDIQYPKGGIKCKNYELCQAVLPEWWFECKGNYLCTNCHILFGTWGDPTKGCRTGKGILCFNDNVECPICLEYKRCVSQPNCIHSVCIECFKLCYYGDDSGEPQFPYPDIEEEYWDDSKNFPDDDYPLIKIWNDAMDLWEFNKEENTFRSCPLCRK